MKTRRPSALVAAGVPDGSIGNSAVADGVLAAGKLDWTTMPAGLADGDDGLPDAWQPGHFAGAPGDAGPGRDPDTDGADNVTEFVTGTDPTNGLSYFRLTRIALAPPAQGGQAAVSFSPTFAGRVYRLEQAARMAQAAGV